jgi:hypothetical protein
MRSLPELQAGFAAALMDVASAGTAPAMFRGTPERAASRLAIYRANVECNCAQALASAYPIVRKIVGDAFFDALAHAHLKAQPSQSGDLNRYGERLPEFLEDFAPVSDLPYLPDVARMEWHAHRAHFAAEPRAFNVAALADLPPERIASLRPGLAPACALLESAWPLGRIWTIHQDDYGGAFEIDLDSGPDRILVIRPRWRAQVVSLAPGDFAFLGTAHRGGTLGTALESAVAADPSFDPGSALARWIHAHVIDHLV